MLVNTSRFISILTALVTPQTNYPGSTHGFVFVLIPGDFQRLTHGVSGLFSLRDVVVSQQFVRRNRWLEVRECLPPTTGTSIPSMIDILLRSANACHSLYGVKNKLTSRDEISCLRNRGGRTPGIEIGAELVISREPSLGSLESLSPFVPEGFMALLEAFPLFPHRA